MKHQAVALAKAGLVALTLAGAAAMVASAFTMPAFADPNGSSGGGGGGSSSGGGSGGGGGGGGGGSGGGGSMGSGGSGGGGGGSGAGDIVCSSGFTYSPTKHICIKSSMLEDRELYDQGRLLALAGHYREAIGTLKAVRNQSDAMVLTMIGYSTRKLGDTKGGIAYYYKALAIEPDNIHTREYLGEGYVKLGRLDLAQGELDRIEKVCGTECDQYIDLAAAMAGDADWH